VVRIPGLPFFFFLSLFFSASENHVGLKFVFFLPLLFFSPFFAWRQRRCNNSKRFPPPFSPFFPSLSVMAPGFLAPNLKRSCVFLLFLCLFPSFLLFFSPPFFSGHYKEGIFSSCISPFSMSVVGQEEGPLILFFLSPSLPTPY